MNRMMPKNLLFSRTMDFLETLELISRMLGHSTTEVTKRYAIPSIEMMRKAMEKGTLNGASEEMPLWQGKEDDLIRLCGLRP